MGVRPYPEEKASSYSTNPTIYRDRRKTHAATFANFIHQKDANLAMFMILDNMEFGSSLYRSREFHYFSY